MKRILIKTSDRTYPVYIGTAAIEGLGSYIKDTFPALTNIMIITDETVRDLHLPKLKAALTGMEAKVCTVPSGEKAKTFEVYYQCLSFALEHKLDRKSLILAFGGGAVGDLAGFAAATFMRGIPFIQIPTTILAHDSAVGGKVAINHPSGKNMVGSFYQPQAVFYDLAFLDSLPQKEMRSGFAEVIKHSLIDDMNFYLNLKNNIHTLESLPSGELSKMLTKGIEIKGRIVAEDEKEAGVRAFLNFGHTLGHAIEAEKGYGEWTHGESVAVGMLFALQLSKTLLDLCFDVNEFKRWLDQLGYKTDLPEDLSHSKLLERMKQDKKSEGQNVRYVLLEEVGKPVIYQVSDDLILRELALFTK
ncbi:3-dehydroquinate synthase [Cytobacillus firmus]|uniref:3-dehydroquinate synthase n=1 Tax=Cytobacillus firmus TaxID=1399 RepID=A0A380XY42_CYTFI|nr:3-dehydroquinate synthase [Cytobacillus firmus]KAF0825950.1 3-dehydroquinate synthase [Cytobacillus firmus]MBG9544562.1 3-dehydroquinate synthase [Cytobacillus firmus]MBG9552989.1 3-dehydroquinate synthase [Cytobacillus firmus]MBG9555273.1 3-dehydroquinate synthase [Cytobacillus firmus]MBG9573557.1 3-dehydroquinate synthase [Cytobacillus firmus]